MDGERIIHRVIIPDGNEKCYIGIKKYEFIMSEQEFKSYRLVSLSEPSDEMLSMLMDKAAEEVRKNNLRSKKAFFDNLRKASSSRKASRNLSN